jgi:hypothetical protein
MWWKDCSSADCWERLKGANQMKNCPNCKFAVSDTAKFCRNCGFNIKKYEEENQGGTMFCDECGAKIPLGSSFCEECGFKLDTNNASASSAGFDFGAINNISTVATEQLYEQNGLKVENGVLVEYTGKKRNVVIPGTIEEIFDKVFENNEFVTNVTIEEGVQVIGKRSFASCPSLVEISIPSTCQTIFEDAFEDTNIERLVLNNLDTCVVKRFLSGSVAIYIEDEEIAERTIKRDNAFVVDIKSLEKIAEENKRKAVEEVRIKNIFDIKNGVLTKYKGDTASVIISFLATSIGKCAFKECKELKSVEIPSNITYIDDEAFSCCENLTSIEIPDSVTKVGSHLFYGCKSLSTVKISNRLTEIGRAMFACCNGLKTVEIPKSVRTIGDYAFSNCTSLTSIEIPKSVTTINSWAFYGCTNLKTIKVSRYCNCVACWKYDCPAEVIYID